MHLIELVGGVDVVCFDVVLSLASLESSLLLFNDILWTVTDRFN